MRTRKQIRSKNYDYSRFGWYFITICLQDRRCLLGNVIDNVMELNEFGKIVENEWIKIPKRFKNIVLDQYQIMPNHIHMIIHIVGAGFMPARNQGFIPARDKQANIVKTTTRIRATTRVAPTLGDIIGAFKSLTTRIYIENVKNNGWQPFNKRLWQRGFYEHIIRNENELNKIREYIQINPQMWKKDINYIDQN